MSYRLIAVLAILTMLFQACTARKEEPPRHVPAHKPPATAWPAVPPAAMPVPVKPEPVPPEGPGIADRSDVDAFVSEMSRKHGFERAELLDAFARTHFQSGVLKAISKPYEAKPWHAYRKLFLTEKRIMGGKEFRTRNAAALRSAETRFGVSPDIITAIIGIESSYGQRPGSYRVMESLSTLAFQYPRRAKFFRKELEQFLLLCREEGMDFLEPLGSYAGAMGMPQFMPSSYRKLSADGDHDGKRDIWNNPADAIASVARYFSASHWHTGEPIAVPARVTGSAYRSLLSKKIRPSRSLAALAASGVEPEYPVSGRSEGALVQLEGETGPLHWIVFRNFTAIMRYNNSPLYAMAAYELSRELGAPAR